MESNAVTTNTLSWKELSAFGTQDEDRINGPTNSYSVLRLFGQSKENIRVTLYRDHHAWCPYCQKVWLWLEWKKIPYQIKKVTMRCYGKKENWYIKKVPSGMLPALELDKKIITESDQILIELEREFGPLGTPLEDPQSLRFRNLERRLFRAWCIWLCNPSLLKKQPKKQFQVVAQELEDQLNTGKEPWLDPVFKNSKYSYPGSSDVIFIPYVERMNASLTYYKGLCLREEYPGINRWFQSLENLDEYRGTQGDFHTHAHDLPPQMGGCWFDYNAKQKFFSTAIDSGEGLGKLETNFTPQESSNIEPASIAVTRILKHRETIMQVNPLGPKLFDQPLRAALTLLVTQKICPPNKGSAVGLRYLRDRISVPRDMPLLAARSIRQALEKTAHLDNSKQSTAIPTRNRYDQDPEPFLSNS